MKKNEEKKIKPVKEDKANRASSENVEESKRNPYDYQDEFLDDTGKGEERKPEYKAIQEPPPVPGEHYKGNGNP